MSLPGGIRTRLTLALVAAVLTALGVAYLIVVPSLENQLVEAKLEQLERVAEPLSAQLPPNQFFWDDYVEQFSITASARVVVYRALSVDPPALVVIADSRQSRSTDVEDDPVALQAIESGDTERGRVQRLTGSYGEVAVPVSGLGAVVVFSAPLSDSLANVELVERRLLAAGGVAILVAVALGWAIAAVHARRIRRLEAAAERIAGGRFDEPLVDRADDELAQLARTFDRMRVQLAQLDLARREFIANASHELRTPIFSLGGFLELMADEDLDEATRREFLETMREQVERLTKLATDLLDLSRMDAGRLRVEREHVDLAELVRTLADELRALAETTGHPLEAALGDGVVADADAERVLQIGRALAGNALLHTPAGTRVLLRAERRFDRAVLAVEDDGPGIPEGDRERVFERFHRVEGRAASGSGLGLAIARELAALMGGELRLDSTPGRTVFTLELPLARETAARRAPVFT